MIRKNNNILLLVFVVLAIVSLMNYSKVNAKSKKEVFSNVYITAAHVVLDSDYKLLYKDEERDVAYYLKEDLVQTKVSLGKVTINGLSDAKIVESYPGYFLVETTDKDNIINGLSGTRVTRSETGEDIGFVEALVQGGKIKCITLE